MLCGAVFYDPHHTYIPLEHAFYGALHRPIWCLGTIGFIFAVGYSEHGFLYNCLAWKPWIPLGKLVFCAYLVHFPMQTMAIAKSAAPNVLAYYDIVSIRRTKMFSSF